MKEEDYMQQEHERQEQEAEAAQDAARDEYYQVQYLLTESLRVLKWNMDNCSPIDKNLHSDFFNENANIISNLERYLNPIPPKSDVVVNDDLPF